MNCCSCGKTIEPGDRFERYSQKSDDERLICGPCVTKLIRDTLRAFAAVPEHRRDEIMFELEL